MKSIEYVNNKMLAALDEYDAARAALDTDPEARLKMATALIENSIYAELYDFGEMPMMLMVRWHGIMLRELADELAGM